jgi:hypothetical protein
MSRTTNPWNSTCNHTFLLLRVHSWPEVRVVGYIYLDDSRTCRVASSTLIYRITILSRFFSSENRQSGTVCRAR